MLIIAILVGSLTVFAGVAVCLPGKNAENAKNPVPAASSTVSSNAAGTDSATPAAPDTGATDATASTGDNSHPVASTVVADVPLPTVAQPELVSPISPLGVVREYYSETYTIGAFTVAWRPGAFPAAYAQDIAAQAQRGLDEVNAFMGINDPGGITVYLADKMFDEHCRGCQGFAASDLLQVFILQDGSVAPDEVQSLLTHEIAHVLAGNHIALPHSLFFAEGFATVLMDNDVAAAGYVPSLQTAAWAYKAGVLPSLSYLLNDATYDGRVRKRLEYDGAASFSRFIIDTYGLDKYEALYTYRDPQAVLNTTWDALEPQWHAYLGQWSDKVVNGVDGVAWWNVAKGVTAGFGTLYERPDTVSPEDYARLTVARLALFRLDLPTAVRYANESNLVPQTAT